MADEHKTPEWERSIALFMDFENIAEGAREAKAKFEIDLVIQRLLDKGKIIVRRAYCDWSRFSGYKQGLHQAGVEMIEIPPRRVAGKNSADIRMVVDALDLCYQKAHVGTFALVTGDSDFSPLVSKLRENDKYVIGIGAKNSSGQLLIASCDEFIFYEDLLREQKKAPKVKGLSKEQTEAFGYLIETVRALERENTEVLYSSLVKDTMKRKRPSFDEGYHGYSSFSKLLEDAQRHEVVKIEKSPKSGTYVVTALGEKA